MPNIIDILARALSLRQETALNSITPNRAGGIMYDTLLVLNQMQLEGGSLLISKVYASVSAMEADTTPTSDLTGRALKPGQLVVIVTSDSSSSDMGSEYRYNGPGSWTYVGKVGGLPLDTVPTQSSTKGITSGGVYTALAAMKAEGYKYMGIASPGSGGTTPGTPNQPVFYIAGPGSYPNFGSITVASGYLGFLKYSSGSWTVDSVAVGKDYDQQLSEIEGEVSQLEHKVDELSKDAGIPIDYSKLVSASGGVTVDYIGKAGDKLNIKLIANGVISPTASIPIYENTGTGVLLGNVSPGGTLVATLQNDITKFYMWVSSTNFVASGTVTLSVDNQDSLKAELLNVINEQEVYAYFASGDKPKFTVGTGTINVAFPANALTINYKNGGERYNLSAFASQNWNVPAGQRLVYDIDNNTMAVKGRLSTGNFVVLFENGNKGFDGLLASYFLYQEQNDNLANTKKTIDPVVYFASYGKPSFAIDKQGQVIVTFPANEMRIYTRNGGNSLITTTAFANQSYTIGQLQRLVYEVDTQTMSVKGYTATATEQIVMLANRDGMNIGGILSPYYEEWLATNDIIGENNPAEVRNILQQANFPGKIGTTNQAKQLVLAHFSDIHNASSELSRIARFTTVFKNYITDVLCTGDLVGTAYNNMTDEQFATFWADATKFLVAIGNHDSAKETGGSYDWTFYAGKDSYDRYIAPYISQWGVTQPSNASTNGYCYYYKDYTQEGIRLIVLDAMKYDTTQDDWFKGVLASAQTSGLAVIVAEHFPPANIIHTNNVFDAPGPDFWRGSDVNILNPLAAQAVDGFMNGTLAGMTDNGIFICWLAGHTHKDTFAKLEDYPNQYCVLVTCATASNTYGDQDRVRGTKSQDAFNIVAVDTYSKTLRLFRIGADYDRFFRHRFTLCWNYDTHELVYES